MPKKILVVDDEQSMRETLEMMLEGEGFSVSCAEGGAEALSMCESGRYDLVVTDIKMPGMDGIELLKTLFSKGIDIPVIVITAAATKSDAIAALNLGASFFIEKPFGKQEFMNFVKRAIRMEELILENKRLKARIAETTGLDSIVGTSKKITAVKEMIKKVAKTESTVLVTGESGVGKEVVARAVHALSPRAEGPFVAVNCGAIPTELLESELFGHVKGSFTGAVKDKTGLMETADGGTFFLDEVGNTQPSTQMKILRAIQEREILPVGEQRPRRVDIRLIAASNENLEDLIERGEFRKDLYYRLNVINIHIPPLRERREDIDILFMQNVVERIVALAPDGKVTGNLLPDHIRNPVPGKLVGGKTSRIPCMDEIEKAYIHWVLTQQRGQKQKAAEILGIGRSTLDRKIEKYGLDSI